MSEESIRKAAAQFGHGIQSIEPINAGLIHDTYRVRYEQGPSVLLQCLNQHSFAQPENIIRNYRKMSSFLEEKQTGNIPALMPARDGHYFFLEENPADESINYWRATAFIENCISFSRLDSPQLASVAAASYAEFTRSLEGLEQEGWHPVISGFHDLSARFRQFEQAQEHARLFRLMKATHIIATLREKYHYVELYERIINDEVNFPTRFMHHDCKLNNILFDAVTKEAKAVVDLDTVMPGKFFSDLGDMIRTMTCTEDEESRQWEKIDIDPELFNAILTGYTTAMQQRLTEAEMMHLKDAGFLVIYMQTLRYTADYLNNDIYYKTSEPDHNLYRAFNQLILLEKLETMS